MRLDRYAPADTARPETRAERRAARARVHNRRLRLAQLMRRRIAAGLMDCSDLWRSYIFVTLREDVTEK